MDTLEAKWGVCKEQGFISRPCDQDLCQSQEPDA